MAGEMLKIAAMKGDYMEVVNIMQDMSTTKEERTTAFLCAAQNGHEDATRRLSLEEGMDVNHVNQDGKSASMLAKENGHDNIVRLLSNLDAQRRLNAIAEYTYYKHDCVWENQLARGDIDIDGYHCALMGKPVGSPSVREGIANELLTALERLPDQELTEVSSRLHKLAVRVGYMASS